MPSAPAVFLYDDSAYVETAVRPRHTGGEAPAGLVGREVAGREFLDAYLTHAKADEFAALVTNQASADSLSRLWALHAGGQASGRRVRIMPLGGFADEFFPASAGPVLYTPCPPDPALAWARQHGGAGAFALAGVSHTLCTAGAARVLGEMVTAPYEEYDALICTSAAVVRMVRALTGAYAEYLRDRHGGQPALRLRLERIPLGVNPEKFRPASAEERAARRAALHVAPEATAVLFVGRFAPHAKAHPFPMFAGLVEAARRTGRKVHLLLSGWAANVSMLQAFIDGARTFAAGLPVSVVDGMDPEMRFGVWQAADLFTSLSDSIQETFGLVILEAMACGLPVVASDWDGYRDLVVDGQTGLLVPTYLVLGATADATVRLLLQATDYDRFLAECNQTAVVDPAAAADAYTRLIGEPALARQMGAAGRQRVLEQFTWAHVVRAYEKLWDSQQTQLRRLPAAGPPGFATPACYPAPECTFAAYPSRLLGDEELVACGVDTAAVLGQVLSQGLTNYAAERRVNAEAALLGVLGMTPLSVAEAAAALGGGARGRASVAWMLKYGLLRVPGSEAAGDTGPRKG